MRTILAEPVTAERFQPFGEVISTLSRVGRAANQGTALRFDHAATLQTLRPLARGNLAVFQSIPQTLPLAVRLLERHPYSSQAFLPLDCARYLICVAPSGAGGGPDVDRLQAFVCPGNVGVNYRAGVWHHPMVALDRHAEFAMVAWEDGTADDCQEHPFDNPVSIDVAER